MILSLDTSGPLFSIAILNKDHTEVQTKIKIINRKIGKNCFEKLNPIKITIFSK